MGAVPDVIDGQVTAALFRQPAWWGMSETVVFQEEVTDYNRMLELANMAGQNIRLIEVPEVVGIPAERFADAKAVVVRTNPINGQDEVLGWVSPDYEVRQIEEIFSWAQFGPTEGARWESAGQMKNGTQVFGSIAFDREIVLDPNGVSDITRLYLLVAGSFDSTLANRGAVTPVRAVCENTVNIALAGGKNTFSFKSTKNIRDRVAMWQKAVETSHGYFDAFEKEAAELYAAPVSKGQFFDGIVPVFYPEPEEDKKGSMKKYERRIENLAELWQGPTNVMLPDSAWKALNVLTEDNQWNRQIRKGNTDNAYAAGAGFDNATNAFRDQALVVVKEFAGI